MPERIDKLTNCSKSLQAVITTTCLLTNRFLRRPPPPVAAAPPRSLKQPRGCMTGRMSFLTLAAPWTLAWKKYKAPKMNNTQVSAHKTVEG